MKLVSHSLRCVSLDAATASWTSALMAHTNHRGLCACIGPLKFKVSLTYKQLPPSLSIAYPSTVTQWHILGHIMTHLSKTSAINGLTTLHRRYSKRSDPALSGCVDWFPGKAPSSWIGVGICWPTCVSIVRRYVLIEEKKGDARNNWNLPPSPVYAHDTQTIKNNHVPLLALLDLTCGSALWPLGKGEKVR